MFGFFQPGRQQNRARQMIMAAHGQFPSDMRIDRMWAARDNQQGWQNVYRLHYYLAKRQVWENDPTADLTKVYVGFPSLGPAATPDNVMLEMIKVYDALRRGDYEVIEDLDDD